MNNFIKQGNVLTVVPQMTKRRGLCRASYAKRPKTTRPTIAKAPTDMLLPAEALEGLLEAVGEDEVEAEPDGEEMPDVVFEAAVEELPVPEAVVVIPPGSSVKFGAFPFTAPSLISPIQSPLILSPSILKLLRNVPKHSLRVLSWGAEVKLQ